jgi:hypothetical protein
MSLRDATASYRHIQEQYITIRVCRIHNFFFRFEANISEYLRILFASYSYVSEYSQTPFIRIIPFLFASKYSHKFAIFDLMKNKCMLKRIYASQNIGFEANIRKTSSEFHIQKYSLVNICIQAVFTCKYSHISEHLQVLRLN